MRFTDNVKKVLFDSMGRWKTILTANNQVLGEVNIKRGIFQGDILSPILFVIVLIPLSMTFWRMEYGYQLEKEDKLFTRYLLLVTFYLLLVTRYFLLVTCYFLLILVTNK